MAVPIHFLINSPHESSDDEFNLSEISYSSDDDESMEEVESSELVNTNAGSLSSPLSNLEHDEETEANGGSIEEDEFWVKYPYLKELVEIIVSQGLISEDDAFERVKLIGDDKAKELNDGWKALCIEQDLGNEMLALLASTMK
ncbi:PREDICTED: GLABROUS1 enhancer-binding protein-like [Camelina sativa]|uniref:GLABROUS1 enhancer-binding protein-like n=1 Tax=Camelina sativa TaxID=90675 RepID=A0ABM0Z5Z5_CAMSA|nr:PREDICTED: GLABROUS1 enhancer-binding protein-like [Camelina sativa]